MSSSFIWIIIPLALAKSVPLLLAAMGGLFSERTGVVNIGLEGMMLGGALAAVVGSFYSHSPWVGLFMAILVGVLFALILAVTGISWGMDQIVSGIAINILAIGITGTVLFKVFNVHGSSPSVEKLPVIPAVWWGKIPIIGGVVSRFLGTQSVIFYIAVFIVMASHFLIYKTALGLRMRAVGEDPSVAASCGINVFRLRYFGVILSGILSGMAGAYLSLGELSQFVERMTGGRGFIALAALIFGKWKPKGVMAACMFFGLAEALAETLQGGSLLIPSQFLLMLPFILTLIVLSGWIGEAQPPAADGKPYTGE